MSNAIEINPEQALKILTEVAALPLLKLSLQEHATVQAALERVRASLAELDALRAEKKLTPLPAKDTV